MTTEPKLLTEAEAKSIAWGTNPHNIMFELRERGLIAPEPMDALLIEARKIREQWLDHQHEGSIDALLAALKRGMELAQPPLTQEMVRESLAGAMFDTVGLIVTGQDFTNLTTRLHAALTGATK